MSGDKLFKIIFNLTNSNGNKYCDKKTFEKLNSDATSENINSLWTKMDINQDNLVTQEEYEKSYSIFNKENKSSNCLINSYDSKFFATLDKDGNYTISNKELQKHYGYDFKNYNYMKEAIFFTERNINKWFTLDKNKDSKVSNAEIKMWENREGQTNFEDMTEEEFAKINGINPGFTDKDFKKWCEL